MVKSWTNEDGVEIEIVEEQETLLLQKKKEFPLFKHLNRKIKKRINIYVDCFHFEMMEKTKSPMLCFIFSKEYVTKITMTVVHIIELVCFLLVVFCVMSLLGVMGYFGILLV